MSAMFSKLDKTPEEIADMALELTEHEKNKFKQFQSLTFEQGVQATLLWLFFNRTAAPTDMPLRVVPANNRCLSDALVEYSQEKGEDS